MRKGWPLGWLWAWCPGLARMPLERGLQPECPVPGPVCRAAAHQRRACAHVHTWETRRDWASPGQSQTSDAAGQSLNVRLEASQVPEGEGTVREGFLARVRIGDTQRDTEKAPWGRRERWGRRGRKPKGPAGLGASGGPQGVVPRASAGSAALLTPGPGLLASKTTGELISNVLSRLVCGTLLHQPPLPRGSQAR